MKRLLILALALAACTAHAPLPPSWDDGLPTGGVVIYHADNGLGVCDGLHSCPTRIVRVGPTCITETYRAPSWEFRDSKPCAAP